MKFKYNPRIIKHLGTALITSDEIAITELIKNSYDARAKEVRLHFLSSLAELKSSEMLSVVPPELFDELRENGDSSLIVLEDNGKGMSVTDLKDAFFEIGTDNKAKLKENKTSDDDIILGDKGIGRLSAQRLSKILFVETTSKKDDIINLVKIDWDNFINQTNEEAPEYYLNKTGLKSYTRLWFLNTTEHELNFSTFFELKKREQIDLFGNKIELGKYRYIVKDDLQSALSFLYSPFEPNQTVLDLKLFNDGNPIELNFNYEILKIAESIHSFDTDIISDEEDKAIDLRIRMKMEIRPWFIERIHQTEIGKVLGQDYKLSSEGYQELLIKYKEKFQNSLKEEILLSDLLQKWKLDDKFLKNILQISPLEGKIFSFKRDASLMKIAVTSAIQNEYISNKTVVTDIRPFLDSNNGIKLYRNKFRVGTIGNKDNDWLKLQQKRTSGQQFYRFELGNVIGYIKLNDFYQQYIYETSSREHLTDNHYVRALQAVLEYIFEAFSPRFTKRAVEISKDILDAEKLIPKNNHQEIKTEVVRSEDILKAANENIKAIQRAFSVIDENIKLENDSQKEIIKKVLLELKNVSNNFEQNIGDTQRSFQNAHKLLQVAEAEQKRIEVEAYNNYKLMANGLVTEVITHELHSLLSHDISREANEKHFAALKQYLFDTKAYSLSKEHLNPLNKKFDSLFLKMNDLNRFYSFLEKTFLYKGNSHDFEKVSVDSYLVELEKRFDFRLKKNKIQIQYETVDQVWIVPKGSLMHVFYNLIDNSIFWIQERQRRASYDATFEHCERDKIVIRGVNENTIHLYDTGTGIFEKYEHTLFNSLESGKENGRGMGLYIVRNFLRSFGGNIELLADKNSHNHRYIFEIKVNNNDLEDYD